MQAQTAKPTFLGNLTLFSAIAALLSCIFTPFSVVSVQGLPQSRRAGTRLPSPKSPSTPLERDKVFVADSDTNVRQMRQISALQIPSPATALSPFATIVRRSPDTNLPRVRQRFPSWPRYNHETMRQLSATKNSPQLRFLSHQLRTLVSPPVFTATKSPGMRQTFRSWLRYNHETNETATPGTATCCDIVTPPPPNPRRPT